MVDAGGVGGAGAFGALASTEEEVVEEEVNNIFLPAVLPLPPPTLTAATASLASPSAPAHISLPKSVGATELVLIFSISSTLFARLQSAPNRHSPRTQNPHRTASFLFGSSTSSLNIFISSAECHQGQFSAEEQHAPNLHVIARTVQSIRCTPAH